MEQNGILLAQGFNVGTTQPVDSRFVLTAEDISKIGNSEYQTIEYVDSFTDPEMPIYHLGVWPEHYFVLNQDDGQLYEFFKDSEAVNGCVFKRVTRNIDLKTIKEVNNIAYVPIDNVTIILDSETGLIRAVPEGLADGVATHLSYDSEGREVVDVLFAKGLEVNSENKLEVKLAEALEFAPDGKIKVVFDGETVVLDSEGALSVPYDDRTIVLNSEGKFEAVYKANEAKGLHLDGITFEVKVDSETVTFNSEGKLVALFTNYEGEHGIEVSEGIIKALTDDASIKVNSEGKLEVQVNRALEVDASGLNVKYDGFTVETDANNQLHVPVQNLVRVEDSEGLIKFSTSEDDVVILTGIGHDETLEVVNGKLHVVAKPVVAGDAIKVTSEGDQDKINVLFDGKSIQLDSEGLFVKIKEKNGLALDGTNGIRVTTDNVTVKIDSEGKLYSVSTPINDIRPIKATTNPDQSVTLSILYDGKTIKNSTSEGLYVPIDKDTIIIDGGIIKAKKQLNADGLTIIEDSEVLHANIDDKTLIKTSGVIETAVGGWKEAAVPITYVNNTYSGAAGIFHLVGGTIYAGEFDLPFTNVPLDSAVADLAVNLKVSGTSILSTSDTNVVVTDYGSIISVGGLSHELIEFTYNKNTNKVSARFDVPSITTANNMPLVNEVEVVMNGQAATYHFIDANYIPIDNNSIIMRGGRLVTAAPSITAGDGLDYVITPTANVLNILTDSESIGIRNDALYIPVLSDHVPAEEDLVLAINSEGKPQFLKRAGVTDVKIDGVSVVSNYEALLPNASDSERGVVKFDNDTLVLNSEGQLKVVNLTEDVMVKEITSEGTTSEASVLDANRVAHVDLTPYSKLDETGYRIELLVDGQHADSEVIGDSEAKYVLTARLLDKAGNVITTSNVADLPLEKMIVGVRTRAIPTSEGTFQTILIFDLVTGGTIEIPMATLTSGYITIFGDYTGTNSIYGTKNFEGELMNYGQEVITQVQVDNKTVKWNDSEVYLEAILPEGRKALELVDLGASYVYDVKYDDETVKVNSENELYVPIDEETIILNAGKVKANIDNRTIIYDTSEQHIELPIDEVTIFVNSQGLLEAAGMDVKPGDAIKITTSEEAGLPVKYLDVLYDEETILLNSENKLYIAIDKDSIIINSEDELEVHQYTVAEIRALWHAICSEGEA